MPDKTDFQNRGREFERNVAALAPSPREDRKGGIMSPDNYKSFIVNIRPTKWETRFWIGKIENFEDAQFIADLVFYYIGHECFHLHNFNFDYPTLECGGASAPLTSREMCFEYVMSIAKGPKPQQKEFIDSVKKLAVEEVKSVKVQRALQQLRNENPPCVIVEEHQEEEEKEDEDEEKEVQSQQSMEVDGPKHLPLVLTSHEWVTRNVDGMNAHVPGFDISDTGFHLQSALTPVGSSWVESYLAGMEDHDGRLNQDAEDFCSATGVVEECSCHHHSAMENIEVNFCAMEDTAVYETGASSSNFLLIGCEM